MSVFRAIVFSSVVVGVVVGAIVSAAQQFGTVPLILKGEVYEAEAKHAASAAASNPSTEGASSHEERIAQQGAANPAHHEAAWEPKEGWERNGFTAAANVLTSIGFALVLGGLYALRDHAVTWHEGLLWGLAGFLAFTMAPGLGLPPELPGVPAAPLGPRQTWWVATAAATAMGLGLIFLRRSPWAATLGLALIASPHIVGAPHLDQVHPNVPEALSRQFVVAVTLTSLLSWALLGSLTAVVYARLSAGSPVRASHPA